MAVKKAPAATPQVDQLTAIALVDPEPASVLLLSYADEAMHALTTRWGYPPFIQRMHMLTSHATRLMIAPLPPSITYARIGVLVSGSGTVTITDSGTSDTTKLTWASQAADQASMAVWVWTGGIPDDTAAVGTAPPLKLRATATWKASMIDTITINPTTVGSGGTIWAVAVAPIWQDIAV
tara:strand:- start:1434 stop:1973 length:540 start_codon:yes stop_codon:yes gene_type:complete